MTIVVSWPLGCFFFCIKLFEIEGHAWHKQPFTQAKPLTMPSFPATATSAVAALAVLQLVSLLAYSDAHGAITFPPPRNAVDSCL